MRKCLIAAAAAGTLVIAVGVPAAQAGTGGEQPPSGVVSSVPASNTPHLKADESTTQQVRQLVQCGNTMYAVGTFDTIVKGSTIYSRNNIFSFSASAPYTVTSWAPSVVGTYGTTSDVSDTLNTIALVNGNCQDAYIGGKFTSVNASGMEGLDPANGNLYVTPDGSVGYYSRDRGLGADDMLVTSAGLWIASDNLDDSQMCGGVENLSGICFLPYSN
jgi:hypothetical protein